MNIAWVLVPIIFCVGLGWPVLLPAQLSSALESQADSLTQLRKAICQKAHDIQSLQLAQSSLLKNPAAKDAKARLAAIDRLEKEIFAAQDHGSRALALGYFAGHLSPDEEFKCGAGSDAVLTSIVQGTSSHLFDLSMDEIESQGGRIAGLFMKKARSKYRQGSYPVFQVSLLDKNLAAANLPAGIGRNANQMVASLSRIPSDRWRVIFLHEMNHLLDSNLAGSERILNDKRLVEAVSELSAKGASLSRLNSAEREQVFLVTRAGLDQGLWGEYRAWVATALLYWEGQKRNSRWPDITDWADFLFANWTSSNSQPDLAQMKESIYQFLRPRFSAPTIPLVREAYEQIDKEIIETQKFPPLNLDWLKIEEN